MSVFSNRDFSDHERVVFHTHEKTGLKCIVAVHNTYRGPALGGTRMWDYASEQDAIDDALRLSKGMTYKNAMADLPFGGGKAVIIGDSKTEKTEELLNVYAELIESLNGIYITAEDVGMTVGDMDIMRKTTQYAHGLPDEAGNPAPATAYGIYVGIKAAVKHKLEKDSLKDVKVAVQGLGNVGTVLCDYLADDGASLWVSDINEERVKEIVEKHKAIAVEPSDIHKTHVDVLSPCALGATLNDVTIPKIQAKIIAGSANNQLAEDRHGQMLKARGILYAPDYVINAGGVIDIAHELADRQYETVLDEVEVIYDRLLEVFKQADAEDLPTNVIANKMAEEKFRK